MRHLLCAYLPYKFQLSEFLICLKYWLFCKKFTQDAAVKQFLHNSVITAFNPTPQKNLMFTSSLLFCLLHSVPNSYPQLQTSIAGVYLSSPSRSSGGRYHNVITLLVYGRLLGGAKKRTIILLQSHFWISEGFNSVVLLQDSAIFHFYFLILQSCNCIKANATIWPRLANDNLKHHLKDIINIYKHLAILMLRESCISIIKQQYCLSIILLVISREGPAWIKSATSWQLLIIRILNIGSLQAFWKREISHSPLCK